MKVTDRVKKVYEEHGVVIQQKAGTLFLINFYLTIGFILFSAIRLVKGDFVVGGVELFVALVLGNNAYLITKGKYWLTSKISVVFFTCCALGLYAIQKK